MDIISNCHTSPSLDKKGLSILARNFSGIIKLLAVWLIFLGGIVLPVLGQAQTKGLVSSEGEKDVIPYVDFQNLGNNRSGARMLSNQTNARLLEDFPDFCQGIFNLNFENGIKVLGSGNPSSSSLSSRYQVNDVYTFRNVVTLPGNIVVHARVTIEQETNGQISLFDNTSAGYPSALQPSFRPNSSTSSGQGFGIFNFEFGTGTYNTSTGEITGFSPIQIPAFNAYLVDVDGVSSVNEFQAVTGGGTATFGQGAAANIETLTDPAPFLNRYQDKTQGSADGIPINVFDRMVRIEFTDVSSFKWKFGVNYRGTGSGTQSDRLFSFYVLCIPGFVPAEGDYSDAPVTYGAPNHLISNSTNINSTPRFGNIVDREPVALPSPNADGDDNSSVDLANIGNVDDEDGVFNGDGSTLSGSFNAGGTKTIRVNTRGTGIMSGWIDWNRDGDFLDVGEQFIVNQSVSGSNTNNSVVVSVPCDAVPGTSYLRVRISTVNNLTPRGTADNGEVEDYKITITDTNNLDAVVITGQPVGATYCQGTLPGNVTNLSVTATGSGIGANSYQWYRNTTNSNTGGELISGATTSTYKPSASVVGITYYYVVVNGNCKPATSAAVAVEVTPATAITTAPVGATYCIDATATALTVAASGTAPITYEWFSNTSN
ncbi:MAG: GEVED domain-containing protein, partial [Algoriphagus sp.]